MVVQEAQEEVGERQVLHLLPYHSGGGTEDEVSDPGDLLARDQRDDWWKRYGTLSGLGYEALPKELAGGHLDEITTQPLLNYLVALSYVRGEIEFSASTNLNTVYGDLLAAVYGRGWDSRHRSLEGISLGKFKRILEEVALASWHGNGRTTTVAAVEKQCEGSGLGDWLSAFEEGARSGVTRLLTAFYFRQSGREAGSGDKTFEFTHKSFGEFLTARRILRLLKVTNQNFHLRSKDADMGWDDRLALEAWLKVCGPSAMDADLHRFVTYECELRGIESCSGWQSSLIGMINFIIKHNWPMESLNPRPSFREERRLSRNALAALLAVLEASSGVTGKISSIEWPADTSFGDLLLDVRGQRSGSENPLVMGCFSRLGLGGQSLLVADLTGATLAETTLAEAKLGNAKLSHAKLSHAKLIKTNLINAKLINADLRYANLTNANLSHADLTNANLINANLSHADLTNVNLINANLINAKLRHADLTDADLTHAKLTGAKLTGARGRD